MKGCLERSTDPASKKLLQCGYCNKCIFGETPTAEQCAQYKSAGVASNVPGTYGSAISGGGAPKPDATKPAPPAPAAAADAPAKKETKSTSPDIGKMIDGYFPGASKYLGGGKNSTTPTKK